MRIISFYRNDYFCSFLVFLLTVLLSSQSVLADISSSSPSQYGTLIEGRNQNFQIEYTYSDATVFWFLNGEMIESNNDLLNFFVNTTEYILENSDIDFDDQDTDLTLTVNVIDNNNPFISDNFTWEYFVEPLDYTFTTDKNTYYASQTVLLDFNAKKGTELEISIYDDDNELVLKYPTVTVDDINEFIIDSPETPGVYEIRVNSKFHEYTKYMSKIIDVEENTNIDLINNFIKISMFPENPSINETVTFKVVMNDYSDLEFDWDFDLDGSFDAVGREVDFVFDEQKSYIVELQIENSETDEKITKHKNFVVNDEKSIVKLIFKDFFTKNVVRSAKVILDGVEYSTDLNGEVMVMLNNDNYELRALHPDYNEYSQILSVNGNYMQTIYLYKTDEFEQAIDSDKSKPQITLISPKKDEIKTELFIDFEFNATDDIYISDCTLFVKPKNAVDWKEKIKKSNLGDRVNQKIRLDLSYDTYLYKVICSDKNNNLQTSPTVEFSVSKYATTTMYRDDIRRIDAFIERIDDAITNPKGFDETHREMYKLFDVEKNLVELANQAREIKTDFSASLMGKESPDKINQKINEINQFMQEKQQQNINRIEVLEKKQFLRKYTKDKIRNIIDDLYGFIFSDETLSKLAENIFAKQENLVIKTKLIRVKKYYLDNTTKIENIILNDIKQKNLNEESIVYQLIPASITSNLKSIIINESFGEVTNTNENNLIVSLYPQQVSGLLYYFIDDEFDMNSIDSIDTVLIDYADKTESIKKIAQKTNDVGSLPENERPNILENIEYSQTKASGKKDSSGLENIQGKLITDNPGEFSATSSFEDIIPYITLSVILGIMLLSGVVMFSTTSFTSSNNEDKIIDEHIEKLQEQINIMQLRISQKIETLIKDEDNFVDELTKNNPDEKKLLSENIKEIEDKINMELNKKMDENSNNFEAVGKELQKDQNSLEKSIKMVNSEVKKDNSSEKESSKPVNINEFHVDEDDDYTKDKILDFGSKIDDLKKDIL